MCGSYQFYKYWFCNCILRILWQRRNLSILRLTPWLSQYLIRNYLFHSVNICVKWQLVYLKQYVISQHKLWYKTSLCIVHETRLPRIYGGGNNLTITKIGPQFRVGTDQLSTSTEIHHHKYSKHSTTSFNFGSL